MVHAEFSNDVSRPDPYRAAARATPATQLQDIDGTRPNMPALRHYRLERVRKELKKADVAGIVLYDPVNIRYATGSRNMAVWTAHNAARYAFVSTDGPVIPFEESLLGREI